MRSQTQLNSREIVNKDAVIPERWWPPLKSAVKPFAEMTRRESVPRQSIFESQLSGVVRLVSFARPDDGCAARESRSEPTSRRACWKLRALYKRITFESIERPIWSETRVGAVHARPGRLYRPASRWQTSSSLRESLSCGTRNAELRFEFASRISLRSSAMGARRAEGFWSVSHLARLRLFQGSARLASRRTHRSARHAPAEACL